MTQAPDSATTTSDAPGVGALARGGALALVGIVVSAVLQFCLVLVVTHTLQKAEAGAFIEAVALFMILSNVTELGADTGLVRMIPRLRATGRESDLRALITAALVPVACFSLLAAAVLAALAGPASALFFSGAEQVDGERLLRYMALAVPAASVLTVMLAGTRGFGSVKAYVGYSNIGAPASRLAAVSCAIALFGPAPAALAAAWTLPIFASLVPVALRLSRLVQAAGRRGRRWSMGVGVEFWRYAAPRALAVTFAVTVTWVDVLLVGSIIGTEQAAVYGAISRLAIVGAYALQAVGMVAAPRFSTFVSTGDGRSLTELYRVSTKWIIVVSWPVYLLMVVYAPLFARAFGPGYSSGATALAVLAASGLVNLATGNVMILLLMAGKSSWNLWDAFGSLVVNIALNLVLIPRFGITGAAIAWSVSIVGTNLVALLQLHRSAGANPLGRGYLLACGVPALCFGATGLLLRSVVDRQLAALALTVVIGLALYLAMLFRYRVELQLSELVDALRLAALRSKPG